MILLQIPSPIQPEVTELPIMKLVFDPNGLWIMIPLFIMFIWATYVFIERYITIGKSAKEEHKFMSNIRDFIHDGKLDSAMALCKGSDKPLARMIEKGLTRIGRPLNDISAAIENTGKLEVSKLEKGVSSLAMIAGAAPMVGFLGTVIGMIMTFHTMASNPNNFDISQLSGGIYVAMITTVAGLVVGIPAYICYNVLVARISKVVNMLENKATEFMDLLHEPL